MADDVQIVYKLIEKALMQQRGRESVVMVLDGPNKELKAGLFAEAVAFRELVWTGQLPQPAANMRDHAKSVDLVAQIFAGDRDNVEIGT